MTKEVEIKARDKKDRDLLNNWHPHISNAMQQLHLKFRNDTKFILTESDLKCWLFYYLQHEEPYIPFAVHTEVTHYAPHLVKDILDDKLYKFRDLSLLCPWELKANEELMKLKGENKNILSKGFKHNASAIHFELKFIRENGTENQIRGLKADIEKLNNYQPKNDSHVRDLVIICGSRSNKTSVDNFIKKLGELKNDKLNGRVWVYLFDTDNLVCFKYYNNIFEEQFKEK